MTRVRSDTRSWRRRRSVAINTVRDIKSPLERLDIKLAKRTPPA